MVQEKSSEFMWQMANYSVDFIKMEHVPRPFVPAFFRIRNIEMNGLSWHMQYEIAAVLTMGKMGQNWF